MRLELELTDEQIALLVDRLAEKLGPVIGKRDGYSMKEAAERMGVSKPTIQRRVLAGLIPTIPGISPTRIPADFVSRMMNPKDA